MNINSNPDDKKNNDYDERNDLAMNEQEERNLSYYYETYVQEKEPLHKACDIKHAPKPNPYEKKKKHSFKRIASIACLGIMFGSVGLGVGLNIAPNLRTTAEVAESVAPAAEVTFTSSNTSLPLSAANQNVASIIKAVEDSIVSINIEAKQQNVFNQSFPVTGAGSGIIFGEDNEKVYIVTNNHVISGANHVTISIDDDKQAVANFVGSDPKSDLAVISVTKEALTTAGIDSYTVANFGDSDSLEVGETVVAIGNALGEGKTATLGIISAKNKEITIDGTTLNVIQTDAAINPGNSGGALVNNNAQIIGINTAKLSSSGIEGMGYSIPVDHAKTIVDKLMKGGSIQTPVLGIQGMTVTTDMKDMYNLPAQGVYIGAVARNSAASAAGLQQGDIIVGFNDKKITSMEELSEIIAASKVGDNAKLYIYTQNGTPSVLSVTLGGTVNETNF